MPKWKKRKPKRVECNNFQFECMFVFIKPNKIVGGFCFFKHFFLFLAFFSFTFETVLSTVDALKYILFWKAFWIIWFWSFVSFAIQDTEWITIYRMKGIDKRDMFIYSHSHGRKKIVFLFFFLQDKCVCVCVIEAFSKDE